jgi:hypothetical protein
MTFFNTANARARKTPGIIAVAGLGGALALSFATAAQAKPATHAQHEAWRDAIGRTPVPQEGCFTAAYPSLAWHQVACKVAPARPYVPRSGGAGFTVGNGNDYSAVVTGLISTTVGTFPTITGLKKEKGAGVKNAYSLQINSQFFASPTCSGASNPSKCLGWEQFVYSTTGAAFMQYWLIDYNATCPSGGWMKYSTDCYRNSAAVGVPAEVITELSTLKLSGTAISNGTDTLVFTTSTRAYTTTGSDSVVDLGAFWNASEWNVIGDGGGSQAVFNKGTSITVNIALTDGSTAAPTCEAHDGTTGETNNLTLGACTASGGATPSVQFTESLAKK